MGFMDMFNSENTKKIEEMAREGEREGSRQRLSWAADREREANRFEEDAKRWRNVSPEHAEPYQRAADRCREDARIFRGRNR